MSIHQSITDPHEPTPAARAARARVMAGQFTRADAEALMASRATGDYHLGLRVMRTLTREANEARRVPVHRFVGPADGWRSNIGSPDAWDYSMEADDHRREMEPGAAHRSVRMWVWAAAGTAAFWLALIG